MSSITKNAGSVLNYSMGWGPETGANDGGSTDDGWLQGDTIVSSTWSIDGPDGALLIDSDTNTDTVGNVVLSKGTPRRWYEATNHIVTVLGRENDRSIHIEMTPTPDYSVIIVPPTDSFTLLEDGVFFALLEDGISKRLLEAQSA